MWYFITGKGNKSHHPTNNVAVVGAETIMGRTLLECSAKNNKSFKVLGDMYNIIASTAIKEKLYSDTLKKYNRVLDNKSNDLPEEIKVVYVNCQLNNKCVSKNHKVISVTTNVLNIKTGNAVSVKVFYCTDCDKYFINYEALEQYFTRGIHPGFKFCFDDNVSSFLKEMSELRLYGYNVKSGGMTENQRHDLLANIIDAELISKAKIIKDLQFKVNYNGKKAGNEKAKKKWENDILFVSHYVKGNSIIIDSKFKK